MAATTWSVRQWLPRHGLPTSSVVDLVQTADGYLWVSTAGGLARFDGVRFEPFGMAHGLPSQRPAGLLAARDGSLWVSTEDGWLCRWDGERFTAWDSGIGLGTAALVQAPDGAIVGASGPLQWRFRDGAFRILPDQVSSVSVTVAAARELWVTAPDEIPARVQGDRVVPLGPGGARIGRWVRDARGGAPFFFRSLGGDAELLDAAMKLVTRLPGAGAEAPQLVDASGRLWCTSGSGVVVRSPRGGAIEERIELGLGETAYRVFFDGQGGFWVCTRTQGLVRVIPSPLQILRPRGLETAFNTFVAWETAGGDVIVHDGAYRRWRVDGTALVPAEREALEAWRGSDRLRFRLRGNRIEIAAADGFTGSCVVPGLQPHVILEDPRDPHALFVVAGAGVSRVAWSGDGRARVATLLPRPADVRSLAADARGTLWVATSAGLWRITPAETTHFTRANGLPVLQVRQLWLDPGGALWMGTYGGGLVRWRDGRFAALTTAHGLVEDVVSVVLPDGLGHLWLAGDRGIQRVAIADAESCLAGRRRRVPVLAFGAEHGLRNPEGSGQGGIATRDGRLAFPTFDGLAVLDVRSDSAFTRVPTRVRIESVRAGDSTFARRAIGFHLPAGPGRIEIRYTGIDLRAPEQIQFRYRLEGVDADWVDAGDSRSAVYTNIGPGRRRFQVAAVGAGGTTSDVADAVTLEVAPRFWQTPWFAVLALAAVITGVVALQRRRERRLRVAAATLQRAVEERTADLAAQTVRTEQALITVEAQAERLAALDRARSRMFASISHEFRTPLTLIQGPLQDLRAGELGALGERQDAQVELALESATRLHRLVDQLLDATRAEAGELRVSRRPGDLRGPLVALADAFAPLARRKAITFTVDIADQPLVASFDPDALDKVIANLLGNALKFTPAGGNVGLVARVDDGAAEIVVRDDGPGIAEQDLPHIFERFYRAERSVTRIQPGTGLGLALASDLVELHDGSLRVTSREGEGSTFTVRLALLPASAVPASDGNGAAPHDPTTLAALAGEVHVIGDETGTDDGPPPDETSAVVMVVDDHPGVRAYLVRRLGRRYRVVEAADGEKALALMRADVPDLVVSDVAMPQMDGHALVQAMRSDPELDFVPVLLLTAAAASEARLRGLEGGADDYLVKPFDPRELAARIEQALASRRRLRERVSRAAAIAAMYGAAVAPARVPAADLAPAPLAPRLASAAAQAAAVDKAFVRRVREVIEARMGDEEFDVDQLAEAMGMGRSLFFQRASELMDRTPMTLVFEYRLERAAQMLAAGEGQVGEVAYAVGFRSLSHFTRRFRQRYGKTPSEWRRSG